MSAEPESEEMRFRKGVIALVELTSFAQYDGVLCWWLTGRGTAEIAPDGNRLYCQKKCVGGKSICNGVIEANDGTVRTFEGFLHMCHIIWGIPSWLDAWRLSLAEDGAASSLSLP